MRGARRYRRTRRARGAAVRAQPRREPRSERPRAAAARAPDARARSSRGPPGHGSRERELGKESCDAECEEAQLRLLVVDEVPRSDVRLLERLDLAVDLGERVLVGDAVVVAPGALGDLAHQLLVDGVGAHVLVGRGVEGYRADGVHADVQELRHVRRVERGDVSSVVLAVGQEDHDLRLRLRVAKDVDAGREAGAYGRTTGERAGLDRLDELLRSGVIERRRAKQDRLTAEDDDAHAVIPEPAEKIMDDALDRVDLRGAAETALGQRPRRREDQHDADPLRAPLAGSAD